MLAGGEGGEILEVAFDPVNARQIRLGGEERETRTSACDTRRRLEDEKGGRGEEGEAGRGARAPLYCCRVDFGWEGVLRDMEEVG